MCRWILHLQISHLTGTLKADFERSEAKLSPLAPFLVSFTVLGVNGN